MTTAREESSAASPEPGHRNRSRLGCSIPYCCGLPRIYRCGRASAGAVERAGEGETYDRLGRLRAGQKSGLRAKPECTRCIALLLCSSATMQPPRSRQAAATTYTFEIVEAASPSMPLWGGREKQMCTTSRADRLPSSLLHFWQSGQPRLDAPCGHAAAETESAYYSGHHNLSAVPIQLKSPPPPLGLPR